MQSDKSQSLLVVITPLNLRPNNLRSDCPALQFNHYLELKQEAIEQLLQLRRVEQIRVTESPDNEE